jgi:hypothetical protein
VTAKKSNANKKSLSAVLFKLLRVTVNHEGYIFHNVDEHFGDCFGSVSVLSAVFRREVLKI